MDKSYREAALVHDAYCAEANRRGASYGKAPWQAVHRMFYEACLAGGTDAKKAMAMYAAVWMFGPRITPHSPMGMIANKSKISLLSDDQPFASVPDSVKIRQAKQFAQYIEAKHPSQQKLDSVLVVAEKSLQEGTVLNFSNAATPN